MGNTGRHRVCAGRPALRDGANLRGDIHGEAQILSSDVRFTLTVPREYAPAMAEVVAQLAERISSDRAAAASRVG